MPRGINASYNPDRQHRHLQHANAPGTAWSPRSITISAVNDLQFSAALPVSPTTIAPRRLSVRSRWQFLSRRISVVRTRRGDDPPLVVVRRRRGRNVLAQRFGPSRSAAPFGQCWEYGRDQRLVLLSPSAASNFSAPAWEMAASPGWTTNSA